MSATALLQKAAQMGTTMTTTTGSPSAPTPLMRPHHQQTHVSLHSTCSNGNNTIAGFGLNLAPFAHHKHPSLVQDTRNSFDLTSFDDIAFSGIFNAKGSGSLVDESFSKTTTPKETTRSARNDHETTGTGGSTSQGEGLARDFLGLRPISHSHILNIAGLSNRINTSYDQQRNKCQKPPHG